jgi:hypothetical protein
MQFNLIYFDYEYGMSDLSIKTLSQLFQPLGYAHSQSFLQFLKSHRPLLLLTLQTFLRRVRNSTEKVTFLLIEVW